MPGAPSLKIIRKAKREQKSNFLGPKWSPCSYFRCSYFGGGVGDLDPSCQEGHTLKGCPPCTCPNIKRHPNLSAACKSQCGNSLFISLHACTSEAKNQGPRVKDQEPRTIHAWRSHIYIYTQSHCKVYQEPKIYGDPKIPMQSQ